MKWARQKGFTIVELLIVIVVIAILAAITIVAYNGIQNRAKDTAVQTSVSQASRKVLAQTVLNSDEYPATLADAGVKETGGTTYQYTSDNTTNPKKFCVTATNGAVSYYTSAANPTLQQGICPGHNLVVWDKTQPAANPPVVGPAVDPSTFRTSGASLRLGPGQVAQYVRDGPFTGNTGQIYTITFWMKTDSNWNGTGNNSKVRFSKTDNTYLSECVYNGVKTTWTQVTCSRTVLASTPIFRISVGNDGTVGNIWIDDVTLTLSE